MILRLWAMYDRSRIILSILLTSYLGEVIPSTIESVIYSNPKNLIETNTTILDLSFCSTGLVLGDWNKATSVSQLVHAGVMCILVIIQFMRRSVQTYKATKQWRLSPFINLLVVEGTVYFFVILLWNVMSTLYGFGRISDVRPQNVPALNILAVIPISTLTPRFILNMREMYARSVYGRRGHGIDTGFGLTALSSHMTSRSSIVFADGEGLGHDSEDIPVQRITTSRTSSEP